jgi:hypothetical protein
MAAHGEDAIFQASCAMPKCGNAFSFKREDTRAFELPVLFERRYFYRSELLTSS